MSEKLSTSESELSSRLENGNISDAVVLEDIKREDVSSENTEQAESDSNNQETNESSPKAKHESDLNSQEKMELELNLLDRELKDAIGNFNHMIEVNGVPDGYTYKDYVQNIINKVEQYVHDDIKTEILEKENYLRTIIKYTEIIEKGHHPERGGVDSENAKEVEEESIEKKEEDLADVNTKEEPVEEVAEEKSQEQEFYEIAREDLFKSKEGYRNKKAAYEEALEKYQEEQAAVGFFGKTTTKIKSIFGIKPEIPEAIKKLETKYKEARKEYSENLRHSLIKRGEVSGNKEFQERESVSPAAVEKSKFSKAEAYDSNSFAFKNAFAHKFIIKPHQKAIEKQQEILLSEAEKSRLRKIMLTLSKNKWHIRTGLVVGAGVLGAVTGGAAAAALAGAGMQAGRIAFGSIAGMAGGMAGHAIFSGHVEKSNEALAKQEAFTRKNYISSNLDYLEEQLLKAQKTKDTAEKNQRRASVAGAVLGGGLTAYSMPDMEAAELVNNISQKSGEVMDTSQEALGKALDQMNEEAKDALKALDKVIEESKATAANVSEKVSGSVPDVVKDTYSELTEEAKEQLSNLARQMGVGETDSTPTSKIDDLAYGVQTPETVSSIESGEVVSHMYEVVKGDTLWHIMKREYAEVLDQLPENEHNKILDKFFDKVRDDATLINSLGLKSVDDIDLIYPKENIDIGLIGEELTKMVNGEVGDEGIAIHEKSATLEVKVEGSEETSIPIKINNDPFAYGADSFAGDGVYTPEADISSNTPHTSVPFHTEPIVDASKLNFAETPIPTESTETNLPVPVEPIKTTVPPEKNYFDNIKPEVLPQEMIAKAIDRYVEGIESGTYDFMDRFANHTSPFLFFKEMDLRDFDEFGQSDVRGQFADLARSGGANIKYETYLALNDLVDMMRKEVDAPSDISLNEYFSRYLKEHPQIVEALNSKNFATVQNKLAHDLYYLRS